MDVRCGAPHAYTQRWLWRVSLQLMSRRAHSHPWRTNMLQAVGRLQGPPSTLMARARACKWGVGGGGEGQQLKGGCQTVPELLHLHVGLCWALLACVWPLCMCTSWRAFAHDTCPCACAHRQCQPRGSVLWEHILAGLRQRGWRGRQAG